MRSKAIVLVLVGACAVPKGAEVCRPVSSWSAPSYRCAPLTSTAPIETAPVETTPVEPTPEAPTEVIELRDKVQFETDSAVLLPASRSVLDDVVQNLKSHPDVVRVRIEGHTDSTATPEHNQTLSRERAESVKKYLVSKGIAAGRLTTKGHGQDKPIGDNSTEEGRSQNRRVEFHIVEKK